MRCLEFQPDAKADLSWFCDTGTSGSRGIAKDECRIDLIEDIIDERIRFRSFGDFVIGPHIDKRAIVDLDETLIRCVAERATDMIDIRADREPICHVVVEANVQREVRRFAQFVALNIRRVVKAYKLCHKQADASVQIERVCRLIIGRQFKTVGPRLITIDDERVDIAIGQLRRCNKLWVGDVIIENVTVQLQSAVHALQAGIKLHRCAQFRIVFRQLCRGLFVTEGWRERVAETARTEAARNIGSDAGVFINIVIEADPRQPCFVGFFKVEDGRVANGKEITIAVLIFTLISETSKNL